ncbi:MAG: GSCFA domain-containing protein [Paramuribaculum sp.]|nr:GSCFA domain-containing protein [Paramuribaculum sp.]
MKFRTETQPLPHSGLLSHNDSIFMLGSCFTDNIGVKLHERLFNVTINPFGTLYNPASINHTVQRIVSRQRFTTADITKNSDGRWFSYDCHTKLNNADASQLLDNLNNRLDSAHDFISQATTMCITLGTAWVFTLNSTGQVVANCQKQPASLFTHTRMTVTECTDCLDHTITALKNLNPHIKIILTVSPIRHLANGAHGNQLSKSTLLLACDEATQRHSNVIYFPSYEIMMDDLRSYRYYAADMKHPSDVAVDYIYEIFAQSFFNNDTIELSQQALNLMHRIAHRPINQSPEALHESQLRNQTLINSFVQKHPELQQALEHVLTQNPTIRS